MELSVPGRSSHSPVQACKAVKDPQHLEAVILYYVEGWPIQSKDPKESDLVKHFNATPRQIKYWIATALKQMRAALPGNE
jgi:hypothetical protein